MQLEIKNNNFIELSNLFKVSSLSVDIDYYNFIDNKIVGQYKIIGEYYNNKMNDPIDFERYLPFEILLLKDKIVVTDVNIINVEYFEVEGRGLESEVTLNIKYAINENEYINIVEKVKEEVDSKLKDELNFSDNRDVTTFPKNEARTQIRVKL